VVKEPPQLTHVVGTNLVILHAAESDDGREIQVLAVIDNLVKGAGGQALQAVNLALGLSETAGLVSPAAFPI
jgi:N-acetyl-gamma-glutamyl-phosphate reductase